MRQGNGAFPSGRHTQRTRAYDGPVPSPSAAGRKRRAYFATDLRFRPGLPSPDFVRWGDRVLARIKKKLTRDPESAPPWLYFGASALEWIQSSGAIMTGGAIAFTISGGGEDAVPSP